MFIARAVLIGLIVLLFAIAIAQARDDGRFAAASPEIKKWFDRLASKRGLCCSDADGFAMSDVDWESRDGRYRVRLNGAWHDVPDDAVVTEPNKVGRTMVWPLYLSGGLIEIRCFLPGAMG